MIRNLYYFPKLLLFLNSNDGSFSIIFPAIVALSTIVYAILTWKLVVETKRMRRVQTEPRISISIYPAEEDVHFMELIVENIGYGPAYNIKLQSNSDFEVFYTKKKFSELNLLRNGIKCLVPKQKLQFVLLNTYNEESLKLSFTIHVEYYDDLGNKYYDDFMIDIPELADLWLYKETSLQKIAKALENISQKLK